MDTCFLFVEQLHEDVYLSLRVDALGQLTAPIERRTVDEFRALQEGTSTIVVLPTSLGSLHEVELPKLSDSKARAAIPYILEEQLAESVTASHVAFMRQSHDNHKLLVAVLNKQWVGELINQLTSLHIHFEEITLDWFALEEGEACVHHHQLLVHDATFKGSLGLDLIAYSLKAIQSPLNIITFNNNAPIAYDKVVVTDTNSYHWVAQRLLKHPFLNICQGDFSHDTKQRQTKRWFMLAGILGATWFLVSVLLKMIALLMVKHQVSQVESQISTVYREFFPEAHAVVSPRFRIEQLLKQSQSGSDALLWHLLEQLPASVFSEGADVPNPALRIQSLRYQSASLIVNFECDDFATLEAFESRLHQQRITVRQLSAAEKAKHVTASLELK